ncbi:STAS domain-containing protein [Tropicimonas isoalkanivorans]|uniref:Chemotaxis protein CheX n=1 Tax=Tropicimonas isoalkanivorans TaxID=441112 RepID=A0A1I1KD54_9RHOB|nr:STAS domain-containing protein [Tropicimonas isoalkanivorans]SFC58757.1 chemotaxis protein CheX [Tropicimonas isoalkanivorans]
MTARFSLPARLDLPAATPLAQDLLARRCDALTLAADDVTLLGTPGLQVLLAARRTWEADGQRLAVSSSSPAFEEQLVVFGLSASDLETQPLEP